MTACACVLNKTSALIPAMIIFLVLCNTGDLHERSYKFEV